MITANDLKQRAKKQPFVPLRIVTSSREKYDVYHPDLIWVGTRDVHVGTASLNDPSTYDNNVARLSILHLTALEDLPAKAKKNGKK